MKEYIGKVFHIKKDEETGGMCFDIRTETGEEIWVIVKGEQPSVVEDGAHIIVRGDYSAAMGEIDMKRFIAKHVEAYENPENEEDAADDKLRVRYSSEDFGKFLCSFDDWEKELRKFHAEGLSSFLQNAFEQEKPYIGRMNFLAAVMERFFELGYFSATLTDEGREDCRDMAEYIADMIRHIYRDHEEKLQRFEKAYEFSKESYMKWDSDVVRESGIWDVE